MRIVIDIECNSLANPSKIWVVVTKNIDTGEYNVFKEPLQDEGERQRLLCHLRSADLFAGHNWLEYDYPVLVRLLDDATWADRIVERSCDTLVLSRLFHYSTGASTYSKTSPAVDSVSGLVEEDSGRVSTRAHSLEAYSQILGIPKDNFNDFTRYSQELADRCRRDVDINHGVFNLFWDKFNDPKWKPSIRLEQEFQLIVNDLHNNGFAFNVDKASKILQKVTEDLATLDKEISDAFPAKLVPIKEITPRYTKYGTLHKSDFRWVQSGDLSDFNGGPFTRCKFEPFNPSSHKQLIHVLTKAKWKPIDKTKSHIDVERELRQLSRKAAVPEALTKKLERLKVSGWKINENNLATLPDDAPKPARLLARRILLESRRRTLTEWLGLVGSDDRIHGRFYGIGAWTHRMAHQQPNTANIPNEFDTSGNRKLLGKEMRSLWIAPKGRLLVGVDAEGIQLRIFAHLINDEEFTDALVRGKKSDKTDPHSLNQRILGSVCKSRAAAKRFIYALLLGAGLWKLSQVLECSETETKEALDRLLRRYAGWANLKENNIPKDARRGFFIGLDGRSVCIPGDTKSEREHLAMSGYLQNGEAICMKLATTLFYKELGDNKLVNFVHDEWQCELPSRSIKKGIELADRMSNALVQAGMELNLKCPLAGSYYNDDLRDYTIGTNWSVTH